MVGKAATIRLSSRMVPSLSGTLKSTRTITRWPMREGKFAKLFIDFPFKKNTHMTVSVSFDNGITLIQAQKQIVLPSECIARCMNIHCHTKRPPSKVVSLLGWSLIWFASHQKLIQQWPQ